MNKQHCLVLMAIAFFVGMGCNSTAPVPVTTAISQAADRSTQPNPVAVKTAANVSIRPAKPDDTNEINMAEEEAETNLQPAPAPLTASESGKPDGDSDGPRISHGAEIAEAEDKIPVGKWGLVTLGLVSTPDFYKVMYAEIDFKEDGTYSWHGYHLGAPYTKAGVWHKEGDSTVVMEDKTMVNDPRKIKGLVWMTKTYAKLSSLDGMHSLQPSAGSENGFLWGVHYDLTDKCFYDIRDRRLELSR